MFFYGQNHKKNVQQKIRRKIRKIQENRVFNGKPNLVIFSGAGISQESGIDTFRASNGLWNNHNVNEIATPEGYRKNPEIVIDFYNQRRVDISNAQPNLAHKVIAELEAFYNVTVVTQNIDDLHERAGSSNIYHIHGEINKVQDHGNERNVFELEDLIQDYDKRNPKTNARLRPYVVWFGERPRFITESQKAIMEADVVIVVGTTLKVEPASSLVNYIPTQAKFYFIDPEPNINEDSFINIELVKEKATVGFQKIKNILEVHSLELKEKLSK
jgi:NAD-dependent deacetylase